MSVKTFLDDLLTQGKALAAKGENVAAEKLGFDDSEADRKTLRNTALVGGLAGLLLGSRSGRGLIKTGVLLGGLGWLGKMAHDAYTGSDVQEPEIEKLDGDAAEKRAVAITSAIIAAARADGHIDDKEQAAIERGLGSLPDAVADLVSSQLVRPLDPTAIAALADSEQAAREMYVASLLVTGADNEHELTYLSDLARALKLDASVVAELQKRLETA